MESAPLVALAHRIFRLETIRGTAGKKLTLTIDVILQQLLF